MTQQHQTAPATKHLSESRYAWNQVGVAFLCGGIFNGTIIYAYSLLMVLISADIEASAFEQMWPKTAMMVGGALLAPLIGPMVDRHPIKHFLVLGVVCFAAGLAVVSITNTILQITLVFCLFFGPVQSLLGPLTTSALISRWFTRRRALAIGIGNIGISVGGFTLPILIGHLSQTMEWREMFLVLSGAALLIALPAVVLLTINKPDDYGQAPASGSATSADIAPQHTTRTLLADPGFWSLGLCVGAMYGVNVGILSNLVQIGMEKGLDKGTAAQAIAVLALSGIAGKLTIGFLADRFNKCLLLAAVLLLFALALVLLLRAQDVNTIMLASVLIGFSASSSLPLWHALTASLFGVINFSRVIGLTQLIVFPMVMAGPPLAGFIYDRSGSYDSALKIFSALLLAALLLIIGIRAKEKSVTATT